ncbi:AAA family ATPase [Streptosporangium sp. G11]|uniref:AAA family ATPase n=1 Tax=Streptosporangium sp. G11 TaxID=3436926 RepID=UPI003EBE0A08
MSTLTEPTWVPDVEKVDAGAQVGHTQDPEPNAAPEAKLFISGAAFVLDTPAEVPALWGRSPSVLWAPGEALMVVGRNGVGKTTLAHQLVAGRLGIAQLVLGYPIVPGRGRVLYLACDRPRQIARAMQRLFTEAHRDILHERLVVWQGPPPADFAKNTKLLAQMCIKAEADTVIIDSLKDVALGLSEDAVGAAYNRARQEAITSGVEVLELHHQKKVGNSGGKPNELGDVYGSTWITAGTGSVILLDGNPGDPVVDFRHLKQPATEVGPFQVLHDHDAGLSSIYEARSLLSLTRNFPHGITAQAAAQALFEVTEPSKAEIQKARRKLEGHVTSGRMVCKEANRSGGGTPVKLYFLTTTAEEKP